MADIRRNDDFTIVVEAGADSDSIVLTVGSEIQTSPVVNGFSSFVFSGGLSKAGLFDVEMHGVNIDGAGPSLFGQIEILKRLPGGPKNYTIILGS